MLTASHLMIKTEFNFYLKVLFLLLSDILILHIVSFFQIGSTSKKPLIDSAEDMDTTNGTSEISKLETSPGATRRATFIDNTYNKESFTYLKVIGKGSFGKVRFTPSSLPSWFNIFNC